MTPAPSQAPRIVAQATIYLQYADENDLPAIDQFMGRLRAEGFRTPGSELVPDADFSADVRYVHEGDREDAERALAELTEVLRSRGLAVPSTPRDLSTSYPNVPQGVVEVWIPRLPSG